MFFNFKDRLQTSNIVEHIRFSSVFYQCYWEVIIIDKIFKSYIERKGRLFEKSIYSIINNTLEGERYHIFHDITIQLNNDLKSQIDILLITEYGCCVIEVKSCYDKVEGNINEPIWSVYSGQYKNNIYSPYLQNIRHMRVFKNAFISKFNIRLECKRLICFRSGCTIKSDYKDCLNLDSLLLKLKLNTRIKRKNKLDIDKIYNTILGNSNIFKLGGRHE